MYTASIACLFTVMFLQRVELQWNAILSISLNLAGVCLATDISAQVWNGKLPSAPGETGQWAELPQWQRTQRHWRCIRRWYRLRAAAGMMCEAAGPRARHWARSHDKSPRCPAAARSPSPLRSAWPVGSRRRWRCWTWRSAASELPLRLAQPPELWCL